MKEDHRVVLDCSFTMPLFLSDESSDPIEDLIDKSLKNQVEIIVPTLWMYEVHNVLLTSLRRTRILLREFRDAIEMVQNIPLTYVNFSSSELARVIDLALINNLSFYDASYLCIAIDWHCSIATRDNGLLLSSKKMGIKIYT